MQDSRFTGVAGSSEDDDDVCFDPTDSGLDFGTLRVRLREFGAGSRNSQYPVKSRKKCTVHFTVLYFP